LTNTYVDAITYQKAATGVSLTTLAGNIGRIQVCAVGATSLTLVSAITVALTQYDAIYITDGPNSEILQAGVGGAAIGATTIPLQGATAYAHVGGTAYCTDGSVGSLGQALFESGRVVEDICHQALWQTNYTGEILTMPTMRASIDNQWNLHFRPRHFPITALTSVSIQQNQTYIVSLDQTQAIIDSDQQTVDIPNVNALPSGQQGQGSSQAYIWQPLSRTANAWITLSYTAGYPVGQLPWAVTRAAILLTSSNFAQLENPVGADQITQGKRSVIFTLRGDQSGESLLVKEAMKLLGPYIAESF